MLTRWSGQCTADEMIQLQEQAHVDPGFDHRRYSIHAFSECDHYAVSQSDIQYSAAIDGAASRTNRKIKVAIVGGNAGVLEVGKAPLEVGLSPFPVRFCSTIDEARAWIARAG